MIDIVGKVALIFVDLFVRNTQRKEEIARKVLAGLSKWDREALQSAELRETFNRIERKAKEDRDARTT
jgi:hypothetical protein